MLKRMSLLVPWLQTHVVWLLLSVYVLAMWMPELGAEMRGLGRSGDLPAGLSISLPLLLLALMLFCAAVMADLGKLVSLVRSPNVASLGLIASWIIPILFASFIGWTLQGTESAGLAIGLAIVSTMPVANSSVGWTHQSQGNLSLSLALVIGSILLSPWVTPALLRIVGFSLSVSERTYCEELIAQFSGIRFMVWVILPTLVGFGVRLACSAESLEKWQAPLKLTSLIVLLLLNFMNAALAAPMIAESGSLRILAVGVVLALLLSGCGVAVGWGIGKLQNDWREHQSALMYGVGMKHTGLALVLTGTVLGERQPQAILMIVVATLGQHVVAAASQKFLAGSDPE